LTFSTITIQNKKPVKKKKKNI